MFETVILLLVQICFVVAVAYIIIWVVSQLGLPEMVIKLFWIIVVLIVLLLLYRTLAPLSHGKLFGLLDHLARFG